MKNYRFVLTVALVALTAMPAIAAAEQRDFSAQSIRDQQATIRSEVLAGTGRYQTLDARQREDLVRNQDRVATLLRDVELTTDLPERQQIDLFNALESISAIINADPDGRMICSRGRLTGTNRTETFCQTAAQMRADREVSQSELLRRDLR